MEKLNIIIEDPKLFTDIDFNEYGGSQKFVQLEDNNGLTYIASYPDQDHQAIAKRAINIFNKKGITIITKGGGFLSKIGNEIELSGFSRTLGVGFDASKVIDVMQKAFPELEVNI